MPEVDNNENVRDRIVRLAFAGDEQRFAEFLAELRAVAPPNTPVILRGSAVTGSRWADGQPFDADGPGTSDLDVTFLNREMLDFFETFYIPGLHTAPLSDDCPEAAPRLGGLRTKLCRLAGRPVNIQASTGLVQFMRDVLFDQPYYTLIEGSDEEARESSTA